MNDLVVDSCPQMLRVAQPLISRWYTTRGWALVPCDVRPSQAVVLDDPTV